MLTRLFSSVIHRADYQMLLLREAQDAGVDLRMGADVREIDVDSMEPSVLLKDGTRLFADVIVGADGMFSDGYSSLSSL